MRTDASRAQTTEPASTAGTGELQAAGQPQIGSDGAGEHGSIDVTTIDEAQLLEAQPVVPAETRSARRRTTYIERRIRLVLRGISLDERLGRIILSVVLAALLWFYVTSLENPAQVTQFSGLQLEVRGLGPSLKVINTLPTVNVTVQAPQNLLSNLRETDVRPYVDLAQLDAGVHQVPVIIDTSNIADHSTMIFSVAPANVQVQLEAQATRVFSVAVQVTGTPLQNYAAEPAQVNPSQIQITGSESAINRIAHIVVTVDVNGAGTTQSGYKSPVALDSTGQTISGLTFDPTTVQFVVPIRSIVTTKLVPVHIPIVGNPAPGYSASEIDLNPTNVTICCAPNNILTNIGSIDTNPVSISGTTSTVVTTTQLILPSGVQLYPGQSSEITVTVHIATFETSWQLSVPASVANAAPGLSAILTPASLNLTLSGTLAQFQSLKPSDITAIVDAKGLDPGTYQLDPQVTLPPGIKLQSVNPAKISLSLIAPTPVPPTPTQIPTPQPTATVVVVVPATPTPLPSPTMTALPVPTGVPTSTPTSSATPAPSTPASTATPTSTSTATPGTAPTSTVPAGNAAAEATVPAAPTP